MISKHHATARIEVLLDCAEALVGEAKEIVEENSLGLEDFSLFEDLEKAYELLGLIAAKSDVLERTLRSQTQD